VPISSSDAAQGGAQISSDTSECSEEARERATCLARIIQSETHLQLVIGDNDCVCHDLETQFRYELPVAYPVLFEISPIIIRVRSILFVKDANALLSSYKQQGALVQLWIARCDSLLHSLTSHIANLCSIMSRFAEMGDHDCCLSVRYSIIICFTAKAELCRFLARIQSSTPTDYDQQCEDSLRCIVEMTQGLKSSDFHFLDHFLGLCWSRALTLLLNDPRQLTLDNQPGDSRVLIITESKEKLDVCIAPLPACEFLAQINPRRKPGTPNYLLDSVRLAWGI